MSILCPQRSMPRISSSGSSGWCASSADMSSSGGRSSSSPSTKSIQSCHDRLPVLTASSFWRFPFLSTPGIRDSRDGFLFA